MSVAVSDLIATEEVPGGRAGTETAASRVPAKFLVRVLASLLTEQAKDGCRGSRSASRRRPAAHNSEQEVARRAEPALPP